MEGVRSPCRSPMHGVPSTLASARREKQELETNILKRASSSSSWVLTSTVSLRRTTGSNVAVDSSSPAAGALVGSSADTEGFLG